MKTVPAEGRVPCGRQRQAGHARRAARGRQGARQPGRRCRDPDVRVGAALQQAQSGHDLAAEDGTLQLVVQLLWRAVCATQSAPPTASTVPHGFRSHGSDGLLGRVI